MDVPDRLRPFGATTPSQDGGSDGKSSWPVFEAASGLNSCVVELNVSAKDLHGLHGEPDPFCVVFLKTAGKSDWTEIGRSETRHAQRSPQFDTWFTLVFHFELYQEVRVGVFDRESASDALGAHRLIGVIDTPLSTLTHTPATLGLVNRQAAPGIAIGSVLLTLRKSQQGSQVLKLNWLVSDLDLAAVFGTGKSGQAGGSAAPAALKTAVAPFDSALSIFKKKPGQSSEQVRQEIFTAAASPTEPFIECVQLHCLLADQTAQTWNLVAESTFAPISHVPDRPIPLEIETSQVQLSDNDESRLIRLVVVRVFQKNQLVKGAEDAIPPPGPPFTVLGYVNSNMSAMKVLQPGSALSITGKAGGTLRFLGMEHQDKSSFYDLLSAGVVDFELLSAVDFTSSNGPPNKQNSLHYLDPTGRPNPYEVVIRSVFNVLLPYAKDKRIPSYGFGANLPPAFQTSHCFALTGNPHDPFCNGVEGLMAAYKNTLSAVQLYGPTVLSSVLKTASVIVSRKLAERRGKPLPYHVLLVMTDGILSDRDSTVDELVRASSLPLSVMIVGIGQEDFSAMGPFMDYRPDQSAPPPVQPGRKQLLCSSDGRVALRDNVQFVALRDFGGDMARLAAKLLAVIPTQVMSYIETQGGMR
ncbi:Copine-1 [Porphyridium purpureum]|uniref:Copine-1 n=1 Tax=Porphyridium purpureum TaxID=35688 RepID=A0A5J4Z1Y2_PORPP|nr:Copine-1 [Porphyridium purpureum]|eukprot:POR7357..scf295_1